MKISDLWRVLLFLICLPLMGCGGGGGKYYPPSISLNSERIIKEAFVEEKNGEYEKIFIEDVKVDISNDFFMKGERYYSSKLIIFNNKKLRIAIPLANWVSIITSEGEITKLATPRYVTDAVAVELKGQERESFLAILIEQQATSHSSTLYILNNSLRPIYKEHLLGANWIAKITSTCGDQLLVSTEDKWRPVEQWITIVGKWRYKLFFCP